jgi:hypothetical protein
MDDEPKSENALPELLGRLFPAEMRAWRGRADLATVFWFYGVLTSSILGILYAATIYLRHPVAEQLLLIGFALYTVWILVSIWRCSLATETMWGLLARFLTIAWAGNVAMLLVFRQFELLILFAGLTRAGGAG